MNHAADAVTSLNPDPVKVGDVAGQATQRHGLLQGSVRPVGVVKVFVLPQHGHKVALVHTRVRSARPHQGIGQRIPGSARHPPRVIAGDFRILCRPNTRLSG
jgi:hypothetical protein